MDRISARTTSESISRNARVKSTCSDLRTVGSDRAKASGIPLPREPR